MSYFELISIALFVLIEQTKTARAARLSLESQVKFARREEMKAELQRLQALKANDMETYVQMLAHTKNDRLQFLISQTDSFLETINQKIQSERDKDDNKDNSNNSQLVSSSNNQSDNSKSKQTQQQVEESEENPEITAKLTQASRDYYRSTHRVSEAVHQPVMLQGELFLEGVDIEKIMLLVFRWSIERVSIARLAVDGFIAQQSIVWNFSRRNGTGKGLFSRMFAFSISHLIYSSYSLLHIDNSNNLVAMLFGGSEEERWPFFVHCSFEYNVQLDQ